MSLAPYHGVSGLALNTNTTLVHYGSSPCDDYALQSKNTGFAEHLQTRCLDGKVMRAFARAYNQEEQHNLHFNPPDLDTVDTAACSLKHGFLIDGKSRTHKPLKLTKKACDRFVKNAQTIGGWSCSMTKTGRYRLASYPLAFMPHLLNARNLFEKAFSTCKKAVSSAYEQIIPGWGSRLAGRAVQPKGKSIVVKMKKHYALLAASKILKDSYQKLAATYKQAFAPPDSASEVNASEIVFPAKGPLAVQQRIGYGQMAPEAGCQKDDYACPSGWRTLSEYIADVAPTKEGESKPDWVAIQSLEPMRGIMIAKPRNRNPVFKFCAELGQRIRNLAGWRCKQVGDDFAIQTAPKGMNPWLPSASFEPRFPSCERAIAHAANPWKLTGSNEVFWVDEQSRPVARVGTKPLNTTGLSKQAFRACYPHQNQQGSFYQALGEAAAAMVNAASPMGSIF